MHRQRPSRIVRGAHRSGILGPIFYQMLTVVAARTLAAEIAAWNHSARRAVLRWFLAAFNID